jgi:hypothetical protein
VVVFFVALAIWHPDYGQPLANNFSKAELGNEIELSLDQIGQGVPDTGGGWRAIRPKQ